MKVKVRVKIQDEEKQYPDIAKAEEYNKDEIIEFLSNEFGALKMQFSALKKEYDMINKRNGYLKAENERLHKSEENNIGLQASMKDLNIKYYKLISDYDNLKANYRNYLNTIIEVSREKLEELNRNGVSKND